MRAVIPLLVVLTLVSPIRAGHCETYSTTQPEVEVAGYYVDYVCNQPKCGWPEIWVYEESNGIAGLQGDDERHDDTCHGLIAPDTLVL